MKVRAKAKVKAKAKAKVKAKVRVRARLEVDVAARVRVRTRAAVTAGSEWPCLAAKALHCCARCTRCAGAFWSVFAQRVVGS